MKKEYKKPVAERVPLLMEQFLCQSPFEKYVITEGALDDDSD